MIKDNLKSSLLINKAEETLQHKLILSTESSPVTTISQLGDTDFLSSNKELELWNMELELKNKEMMKTINQTEATTAWYDYSPIGYFTIKENGIIEHFNNSAARMILEDGSLIVGTNFKDYLSKGSHDVFDAMIEKTYRTKTRQSCELTLVSRKNPAHCVYLYLESIVYDKEQCLLTAVNIGKQKEAEVTIEKQIQFFEQVFSKSNVSTQIFDRNGWCVKINPEFTALFGIKPEEIQGEKYNILKDDIIIKAGLLPHLNQVFMDGNTAEWDIYIDPDLKTGSQNSEAAQLNNRWFHNWAYPVFDENGCVSYAIIKHTDITDRKNNEEKLSASEARYRSLFEAAKDGIIILDSKSTRILDVNPFFTQLLGFSRNEIIDKSVHEIGIFNNANDSKEIFDELKGSGYARFDNIVLISKNGKPLHVEFTGNVYSVEKQKVVQCNIRNITERIKAEKEIHTLRKAVEQGPAAITITNDKGKIEFVNNKFIELTQYQPAEVIGKNPRIFNPGHLQEDQYIELWETLRNGRTWEGKFRNRRKDHTYFWEETSISPVKNLDGVISNYILLQNDITEKQQIINDLIKAKEKAEEGDLLKTAFLANMSHEIRTPLNSIIGFSELMSDVEFDQSQLLHFARIIHNSGTKLLTIISDIMDLSRIEAGEIKMEKRRVSLTQLIKNIQKEYLFKAVEKGLDLRIDEASCNDDVFIESDENKLRQILINFVGNAIKFTEEGYIEIGMTRTGDFVQIHVKDTGIGIPLQYQHQIFERFRQVESAYSKRYGGNGLGLAISKALAELLGGKVGMETEHGKGSTFFFTVPVS